MTYRAGTGPHLARAMGVEPDEARFECDICGVHRPVVSPTSNNLMPPKWFFDGKPPPGWRRVQKHDAGKSFDLCPGCWKAPE